MLILFGGGDGGGLSIGADGKVHRIPPWSPETMAELRAANRLVQAARVSREVPVAEVNALAERLIAKALPEVAKGVAVGGGGAFAFLEDDGGFCGTLVPGHPPIPHAFGIPGGSL
jgi:hypothetical protein